MYQINVALSDDEMRSLQSAYLLLAYAAEFRKSEFGDKAAAMFGAVKLITENARAAAIEAKP